MLGDHTPERARRYCIVFVYTKTLKATNFDQYLKASKNFWVQISCFLSRWMKNEGLKTVNDHFGC